MADKQSIFLLDRISLLFSESMKLFCEGLTFHSFSRAQLSEIVSSYDFISKSDCNNCIYIRNMTFPPPFSHLSCTVFSTYKDQDIKWCLLQH